MTKANFNFEGKTALIFGGGKNIGRAIALEFAQRGAILAIADIDGEAATESAEQVRAAGGVAHAFSCDVTSDEDVAATIAAAEADLGELDIVMNNCGILNGGNVEDIPTEAWQKMLDVNLLGMVRSINIILPKMIARGSGYIVNTSSFAGLYPFATSRIHYAASKAAVASMSENLAIYAMPHGVRVSCLCPGPVMTTSTIGMTHFTENYEMRAPGSHLIVKSQEETAQILAEGMEVGRIMIPTHEELWASLTERAASPDAYIAQKIGEFAAGDSGKPSLPEQMRPKR